MASKFQINSDKMLKNLAQYRKKALQASYRATRRAGLQQLTWVVQGSPKNNKTPPIRTAFLRSAGQVFIDGKPAYSAYDNLRIQSKENGKPQIARAGQKKKDSYTFTVVFNTQYAAKMEKGPYKLGEKSARAGNVGPNFLSSHILSDRVALLEGIAKYIKKFT